jgi:hypothetical protein
VDAETQRLLDRGLDMSNLDGATAEEVAAFDQTYIARHGRVHGGLSFMLRERPDALKAFRLYVRTAYEFPEAEETRFGVGPGFFLYYSHLGFLPGVLYLIRGCQAGGFSREDCQDLLGLACLVVGPGGFEAIADALAGYEWIDQESRVKAPDNWDPSIETLHTGLDFSDMRLLPGEAELVETWYDRWLGEVPPWVGFLVKYHPDVLKVQRLRFERALKLLPKQTLPLSMLHFRLMRGDVETIRENVLMARGFGVSKDQVVRTITGAIEYGGEESIAVAATRVADVIGAWPPDDGASVA